MPPEIQTAFIEPFQVAVKSAALDDLKLRLEHVRWPNQETVADCSQGVPLSKMKSLVEYWRTIYDWSRCEKSLNSYPQFTANLDGLKIHFFHIRSSNQNALPMILTHGWPGSVLEFMKVIGPLSEPQDFGGKAEDAFHLVIPSLPGFGFSEKPTETGWSINKIAHNWGALMQSLGYEHYVAQGGDWGSAITRQMALQTLAGLKAIHTNLPVVMPLPPYDTLSVKEEAMLTAMAQYQRWESGYSVQQMTRPQTLGYGLADSPVGQAAWIFEKFNAWMDCNGDSLNVLSYDELLDNIMLYWLQNCGASSARLYWESFEGAFIADRPIPLPCGYSVFAKELYQAPRSWAERCTPHLIHWNELEKGGHFPALEQPDIFVQELRACFQNFRL